MLPKNMSYGSAKGKTNARELLPEEDVWFWDRRIGREEGDNSMGVGGRDGREEGGGVEGAGVEEVGGFCEIRDISIMGIDTRTGAKIEIYRN